MPDVLVQATSSLDAESEAKVQEALDRVASGRTVLVVAHRLSTVQSASEVVVISHGTIAERGTHTELLQKGEQTCTANMIVAVKVFLPAPPNAYMLGAHDFHDSPNIITSLEIEHLRPRCCSHQYTCGMRARQYGYIHKALFKASQPQNKALCAMYLSRARR